MKNIILLSSLIFTFFTSAQGLKLPESKLKMRKSGPFIGVEKGKYLNANLGWELQIKQMKLIKPQTHATSFLLEYNFKQETMGAQVGYWFKVGRLNLTYGARGTWITDFNDNHRFGVTPTIGYKFAQAHFQLGVHIRTKDLPFENANSFFASLRWVFIQNRDFYK